MSACLPPNGSFHWRLDVLSVADVFGARPCQQFPIFAFSWALFLLVVIRGCFWLALNWRYSFNGNAPLFLVTVFAHQSCLTFLCSGVSESVVHLCVGMSVLSQFNYSIEWKLCTKWIKNVYSLTQFIIIHSNTEWEKNDVAHIECVCALFCTSLELHF